MKRLAAHRRVLTLAACALASLAVALGLGLGLAGARRHPSAARPPASSDRAGHQPGNPHGQPAGARLRLAASHRPRSRLGPREAPASGPAVMRIGIPAIDVHAPVIRLHLNRDGTLQVPADTTETGWWAGGTLPGRRGPAVIVGHVDSYRGAAVFFRLRDLRPGDRVYVTPAHRSTVTYTVDRSQQAPKDHFPTRQVYGPTDKATLRLITCTGTFDQATGHYGSNLIVYGHRSS